MLVLRRRSASVWYVGHDLAWGRGRFVCVRVIVFLMLPGAMQRRLSVSFVRNNRIQAATEVAEVV